VFYEGVVKRKIILKLNGHPPFGSRPGIYSSLNPPDPDTDTLWPVTDCPKVGSAPTGRAAARLIMIPTRSFGTQSFYGVDRGGAARRNEAGQHRRDA
jgi:hypothetical protein